MAYLSIDTQTGKEKQGFLPATQKNAERIVSMMEESDAVVGHNIRFDAKVLRRQFGLDLPWSKVHDSMIMARLANDQEPSLSLLGLSLRYLHYTGVQDLRILEYAKTHKLHGDYSKIPKELLSQYTLKQLANTAILFARWYDFLNQNMPELYAVEQKLPEVLLDLEDIGMVVDKDKAKIATVFYDGIIEKTKEELRKLGAPDTLNLNSTDQLAKFLEGRGVILPKLQSGKISTSASSLLNALGIDPAIAVILEYRHAQKLKSTYVESMFKEAEELPNGSFVIHASHSQVGTQTGRFSSSSPNMENLPHEESTGKFIKDMFLSREGYETFSVDFSSLQLIIAGGLSNDLRMIELAEAGTLHDETKLMLFGEGDPEKAKAQRTFAKSMNFAILFGAGIGKVALMLALAETGAKASGTVGFSLVTTKHREEARRMLTRWKEEFKGVWAYRNNLLYQLEHRGFCEDPFGRRHHIPRQHAYKCLVSQIQGVEGMFCKSAMVDLHEFLVRPKKGDLLNVVHDEITFQIKKEHVKKCLGPCIDIMKSQAENRLPVHLGVKCSKWENSWGTTKEI